MKKLVLLAALLAAGSLSAACGGDDGGGAEGSGGSGGAGGSGGSGGSGGAGGIADELELSSIDPTSGPPGTEVTLTGAGFEPGLQVFFGSTAAGAVTVDSSTTLRTTVPEGPSGIVTVTVRTADGRSADLPDSFTVPATAGTVDWAILQFPTEHEGRPGESLVVYGRVYEPGVTTAAGAGPGIEAEAGLGLESEAPESWTWSPMAFNVDVDEQANDEFSGPVVLPGAGAFRFAVRFRLDGGPWVYGDRTGTDDGFSVTDAGLVTVTPEPAAGVDYCRLQFPASLDVTPDTATPPIYGRVFEDGVTTTDDSSGVEAQVGFGAAGTVADDTWAWTPAGFNRREGDEHEFMGSVFTPRVEGTYAYAFRFRLASGGDWLVCDLDGSDSGFDPSQAGTLRVATLPPDPVDWAIVRVSPNSVDLGGEATLETELFEAGETVGAGAAAGFETRFWIGPLGVDPRQSPPDREESGAWAADADGLGGLANDLHRAVFPPDTLGTFAVFAQVIAPDGSITWVDANGTDDGFDPSGPALLEVKAPPAPSLDWAQLLVEPGRTVEPGAEVGVTVELYEAGRTEAPGAAPGIEVSVGVGPRGTDPATAAGWTFTALAFVQDAGPNAANDQWGGSFPAPGAGSYDVAAAVRLDGGDWVYVDRDGTTDGYDPADAMALDVVVAPPPAVDWCNLQYPAPANGGTLVATAGLGTQLIYGRVYEFGVTDMGGQGAGIVSEVGFGADGSDPAAGGWTWSPGFYNVDVDNGFGQLSNDEHQGSLLVPQPGRYDYAFRFSMDAGDTWTYCDGDGSQNGYDPAQAGDLDVR